MLPQNSRDGSFKQRIRESQVSIHPGGFVFPDTEIQTFIDDLGVREARIVANLLEAINEAMRAPQGDHLVPSDVYLIHQIAAIYDNARFRVFMEKILIAIEQGPERILAAHKTVRYAMTLIFDYSIDEAILEKVQQARAQAGKPPA
jgi:hypothetical protein